MLAERMQAGVQVRLSFGRPDAESVAIRDREEGLGGTLAAKIRASLTYYRGLANHDGCEIRLHDTTLYASMFRYDDQLLANPHVYGEPASLNPFDPRSRSGAALALLGAVLPQLFQVDPAGHVVGSLAEDRSVTEMPGATGASFSLAPGRVLEKKKK